jgi:putative hydrolase of the HAD superfamily|tara:strand:+ start:221 stop:877 length:657 start_codon:yes stop_codon:yes gene_type:complete
MRKHMIKAVFWDFGGVITSSPFEAFNKYEKHNNLPSDFLRKVNSTNPDDNAWAKLERSEVNLDEFDLLFEKESKTLGYAIKGKEVIALLQGQVRPEMLNALQRIKGNLIQACLTNNIQSLKEEAFDEGNVSVAGKHDEIMGLFDFVIESSKVNLRKPDPAFYKMACEKAKIEPSEAVFLDDLGINLKPARILGMETIKVINSKDALNELQKLVPIKIL